MTALDAALVASMGAYMAIDKKNWPEAAKRCEEFLSHPDARTDPIDYCHFLTMRSAMVMLAGDIEAGGRALLSLLSTEDRPRIVLYQIRGYLLSVLAQLPGSDAPHPDLKFLIGQTIAQFRGKKRASKAALIATSHNDLTELLESTFPRIRRTQPPTTD